MTVSNENDLAAMTAIGRIVANVLAAMGKAVEPGMTTAELDAIGRRLLSHPRAPTVQYEHTAVATRNGPVVLTLADAA
jgi:methionine aminopeptidase